MSLRAPTYVDPDFQPRRLNSRSQCPTRVEPAWPRRPLRKLLPTTMRPGATSSADGPQGHVISSSRRLDSPDAGQLLGVRHQTNGPHQTLRYVHDEC